MSTELVVRIWTDGKVTAKTQLLKLMEVFENKGVEQGRWKELIIRNTFSRKILQLQESLSCEMVESVLSEHDSDNLHLSIRCALPCWRFNGMIPQEGFVPFWIEAWGNQFLCNAGRLREVEGDAALSIANSGPFIALIEPVETPQVKQVNHSVEHNLERITNLILTIAQDTKPVSMKAFTDEGLYQPLNAHLVYFRDETILLNDLIFLKKLWEEGFPSYRTPPLSKSIDELDMYALHPWRGVVKSRALLTKLSSSINNVDHLGLTSLEHINWRHYDTYETQYGRVVLDYPFWVNSFLDHFYLDLLGLA